MNLRDYVKQKQFEPGTAGSVQIEDGDFALLLIDPLHQPKDSKTGGQIVMAVLQLVVVDDSEGKPDKYLWLPRSLYLKVEQAAGLVRLLSDDDSRVIVQLEREDTVQTDNFGEPRCDRNGRPSMNRKLTFSLHATEDKFGMVTGGVPERVTIQKPQTAANGPEKAAKPRPKPLS